VGRFELADGGTLFLDEVGELTPGAQVKLLRVLESRSFEPVGSSQTVQVDVRIVAATNRDLQAEVSRGAFRSDLFFRLNVIDLATPPLRQRRADIPVLVRDFLGEIAARQGRPIPALDPEAVAALATYDFPGNVRELLHALERAVAMSRGDVIRLGHLPAALRGGAGEDAEDVAGAIQPLSAAVEQFELQYIRHVLAKVGGHRGKAAEALGISRKVLWQRLREEPGPEE
jgi:DNA-binding NtrC family response regulator